MGNAVERPGVQQRLSSSYSSVLGRYILQVMMGPQISENIWAEREYVEPWHKFVSRGFRESADDFYRPEVMDMSWANLVSASRLHSRLKNQDGYRITRDNTGLRQLQRKGITRKQQQEPRQVYVV